MKLRRLPARYGTVIMPLILSVVMSGIVSFIATLKTMGMADGLLHTWLGAWQVSCLVAFPVLLLVLPVVRWVVALFVEPA